MLVLFLGVSDMNSLTILYLPIGKATAIETSLQFSTILFVARIRAT